MGWILVAEIRRGDIALPELQRPFVWKATQVRDLFDSMYKGFPVGSLLFWLTGAEPGARQIGTNTKDHAPRALVVDGQQRLTAPYAVLTGESVLRGDYTTGRIRIAFRPADATFAVTDAAIEKDPEYLADVSTLWQPGNRKPTIRRFIEGLTEKRELDQDERDRLETALEELHDLNKSTFKVVELDADIDEEQVAEIFVRINSEGVKLNQADDLLDRVLAGGVVVSGEITLCIADVDLVRISLRALVASVSAVAEAGVHPEDPP